MFLAKQVTSVCFACLRMLCRNSSSQLISLAKAAASISDMPPTSLMAVDAMIDDYKQLTKVIHALQQIRPRERLSLWRTGTHYPLPCCAVTPPVFCEHLL